MNAIIGRAAASAAVFAGVCAIVSGCLTRPVTTRPPETTTSFTAIVQNQAVNKIDVLFDIDNSASMGDKQQYLVQAIPDLIDELLNPGCVDDGGSPVIDPDSGAPVQSDGGVCTTGQLAFPPVHDLHLGIVTSSLGQRLSEQEDDNDPRNIVCATDNTPAPHVTGISDHNDDQGHLVARTLDVPDGGAATEGPAPGAYVSSYGFAAGSPPNWGGFLDWFPVAENVGVTSNPLPSGLSAIPLETTLVGDFTQMVEGVGIYGCGIESQLESWYRFLLQPDPYATLTLSNPVGGKPKAVWSGVDTTILQERADFLRPDSLVAVVVLTDENDSEIDVRSFGGQGYLFMGSGFRPPRGTSACATSPASPDCQNCPSGSSDPSCAAPADYEVGNDWGNDPNLRHVHMKAKYGIDPQYPWQRYVLGLTSPKIPDRNGEYPPGYDNYVIGVNNCTNPLFAAQLPSGAALSNLTVSPGVSNPTLCKLPLGTARTPAAGSNTSDLVFYAIIGGVPNQLLHYDPASPENSELSPADWVRILGRGPASLGLTDLESLTPAAYDYTGIDPHMIEGYLDRTLATVPTGSGLTDQGAANPYSIASISYDASLTTCKPNPTCPNALTPATSPTASDPINGREWTTELPYDPTATSPSGPHVLSVDRQYACIFKLVDPKTGAPAPRDCTSDSNFYACDCPNVATGLTPDEIPPVCEPGNSTQQVYAKAYPTIRELQVARLMGPQGIVSSLCPIDVADNAARTDPLFGYRPAVSTIINRLKTALTNKCLPEKLPTNSDAGPGVVPCLVLVQMQNASADGAAGGTGTCANPNCPADQGLSVPDPDVLSRFCATAEQEFVAGGGIGVDPATQSVCQLNQLDSQDPDAAADFVDGTCAKSPQPGWCYVTGSTGNGCAQAIVFPASSPPSGSTAFLQCFEQSDSVFDGG